MRIAIYGGSFNPPHVGHLLAAQLVLATSEVDELWFTPTYKHMLGKELLDFDHRIEMTRMMARHIGHRASVSRAEQRLAEKPGFVGSLTVELVRELVREWPNDQFRMVMGSDLLDQSKTWEGWDEIVRLAPPLLVWREGHGARTTPKVSVPDVSSTTVKKLIKEGQDVSGLVPWDVLNYIKERGLYL